MDSQTMEVERTKVMTEFSNALRRSGYGQKLRQDVLLGALKRDWEMRASGAPRYRGENQ